MYELTERQTLEIGGGSGLEGGFPGYEIHPPGAWLDINSGPVMEVMPGVWVRVPGT